MAPFVLLLQLLRQPSAAHLLGLGVAAHLDLLRLRASPWTTSRTICRRSSSRSMLNWALVLNIALRVVMAAIKAANAAEAVRCGSVAAQSSPRPWPVCRFHLLLFGMVMSRVQWISEGGMCRFVPRQQQRNARSVCTHEEQICDLVNNQEEDIGQTVNN